MAFTVRPQKSMIEFHSIHRSDINFGHCLHKRILVPFGHSLVGCRKQSDLQTYGTKETSSVLMFKMQQKGCSIHSNNEDSRNSDSHIMGSGMRFNGHSRKYAVDGPFVENDEKTNNEILHIFCIKGALLAGAKIVDVMTRMNQIPDFPSCINLIRGLINSDQTEKAYMVLQLMVMTGLTPDVITYNMLIGGLCREGRLNDAIDVFEGMSSSGCPPGVITYNTIIRAMCDHGKLDDAILFWKVQLRKGCSPYVVTYAILLQFVCKRFGVRRALKIMEELAVEGCYPDLITYNSMISLTCKHGRYEDATLLVCHLLSRGMKPDVVTYTTLLHPLCVHGYWDRAIDFLDQMILDDCSPNIVTYNSLLQMLCKEGMIDEAIQILYCLGNNTDCSPMVITYNIVFAGLLRHRYMEKAMEVYKHMEKAMEVYKHMVERGHCPDDITYWSLIWGFCGVDLVEEATELLNVIGYNSRRMVRENCYRFMIRRLCQKRKVDTAVQVVKMLVSSGSRYDPLLCSSVVEGIHAAGMIDEALELREKLIEKRLLKR